jgi:peptidoglycan/LPS O-acetylase OafA/YrhL
MSRIALQPRGYIGALDGVRGIAILLVLAFHFGRASTHRLGLSHPLLDACDVGWIGVDLFFVLSGFLITGILYDSRNSEHFLRNFYMRRVLRIFPLYYGTLLLLLLLQGIWPDPRVLVPGSLPWLATYLGNALVALHGWEAIGHPLAHLWSLSVEEHFYLVWPFVLLWGTRRQLMALAAAIAALAFIMRVALMFMDLSADAGFVLTPTRMDALAIGAFCGLAIRGPRGAAGLVRPAVLGTVACSIALLLVVLGRSTVDSHDPVVLTAGLSLLALVCGGLIVIAIAWQPLNRALDNIPLRFFGRYSYGLYILHPIFLEYLFRPRALALFGVHAGTASIGKASYTLFVIAVSVAAAVLSYHFWEKRFLELKRNFA